MNEFRRQTNWFDLQSWLKNIDLIRKQTDDQWAERQSEAAAIALRNRTNIERYDRYKRKGKSLYDKKKDKTPT